MTDDTMTDDTIWKEVADRFADLHAKAEARAEAAEQSRAKFMEQLRVMSGLAEAAQARAEAAETERDMLKAALERRGEIVFGRDGD